MIQLVATDLDGTLLRSDKTISQETAEVLSRLDQKGILFVPATGRTHAELTPSVRVLPFLHYAITCNGSGGYDYEKKQYLFNEEIENDIAVEVAEYCKDQPVHVTMVCEGMRFVQADEAGNIPAFVRENAAPGILDVATVSENLAGLLQESGKPVQKFLIYPMGRDRMGEVLGILRERFPALFISTSGPLFVEVNAPGIDKGKGLRRLCECLDIPLENTLVFGDAANDLAMLRAAGRAVVPENGTDEAKALADSICESCDEDGVRRELERMGI